MTTATWKPRSAAFLGILMLLCHVHFAISNQSEAVITGAPDGDGADTNDDFSSDLLSSESNGIEEHDAGVDSDAQIPSLALDDIGPSSPGPQHSAIVIDESIIVETIDEDENIFDEQQQQQQQKLQYTPPTQFQITAHIQTNLHTGYSYFLPEELLSTSLAHLSFLECGAIGSTTESLPLVSGVFRHVPHTSSLPTRDVSTTNVLLESLEHEIHEKDDEVLMSGIDMLLSEDDEVGTNVNNETKNIDATSNTSNERTNENPKRPSPPKYVVALSSLEITVGGKGNETRKFAAGDVIFIEDSWWGVWDIDGEVEHETIEDATDGVNGTEAKMKGYVMRAYSESEVDLNVLMLTIPNSIHRQWKTAQYSLAMAKREERELRQHQQQLLSANLYERGTKRSWWKLPKLNYSKNQYRQKQHHQLPKPCSLESDPAFVHPSVISSVTLSQHFAQHFTTLLRRSTNPFTSFLPHHHHHYHQELLLPVLLQTTAAVIGGVTALGVVLQLWRYIPGPTAVLFGSACLVGLGTWGFVWLGEQILDQVDLWRERKRFDTLMMVRRKER